MDMDYDGMRFWDYVQIWVLYGIYLFYVAGQLRIDQEPVGFGAWLKAMGD